MKNGFMLATRRLRLRTWLMSDVPAYCRHCNTADVMEFLGGPVVRASVRAEVRWYQQQQRCHGHTFWLVERKRDKGLLGFAGLIRVPERDSPICGKLEIGWRVRADMWRRGYGFEAAHAIVERARRELPGQALYARIHRHNDASQGLARKLGMRRSRQLERLQSGDDVDLQVFTLNVRPTAGATAPSGLKS